MTRGRRLRWVVIGLAIAGLWWADRTFSALGDHQWATVRWDELVLTAEVTGTLKAVDSALIGPPEVPEVWNFKISMMIPEGTEVEEGTPVLGFDASELEQRLQEKQAERDEAKTELDRKEAELELRQVDEEYAQAEAQAFYRKASMKLEVPAELVASKDRRAAELDLELAGRQVEQARAKLESLDKAAREELTAIRNRLERAETKVTELQDTIARMQVMSPRSGTVVYVTDWSGDKRKVGDQCWRARKVLEIPDLTNMKAEGEVDEVDAGRIAVDQAIRLRLDAHPDVEYAGHIRRIGRTVQEKSHDNPLKIVKIEIVLDETDTERMRPGMRFRGEIETGRIPDAVVVPAQAVLPTPDGPVVYRRTLTGQEQVIVRLGKRNQELVQVTGGLEVGDRVLLEPEKEEA